ncbi:hypothetical protein ALI22I_15835 [Saccharothrix sp. ALI-22-I]|nr:hypothetical protein ALI22I_15835 [Saccharothrix sp. ALI-22-I]
MDMEAAFAVLRGYARRNNLKLSEVAVAVTSGAGARPVPHRAALLRRSLRTPERVTCGTPWN